jgi:hypothetical protein
MLSKVTYDFIFDYGGKRRIFFSNQGRHRSAGSPTSPIITNPSWSIFSQNKFAIFLSSKGKQINGIMF